MLSDALIICSAFTTYPTKLGGFSKMDEFVTLVTLRVFGIKRSFTEKRGIHLFPRKF